MENRPMPDCAANGKLVTRADLDLAYHSSLGDPCSPNPDLEVRVWERLQQEYAHVLELDHGDPPCEEEDEAMPDREDIYEFRLFSQPTRHVTPGTSNRLVQRIALRSPTPISAEPGFLVPHRWGSYHFTSSTSEVQTRQFDEAAVSGQHIIQGLKTRWRGCELPWRVTVIKSTTTSASPSKAQEILPTSTKRKRKGKKRRISLRKKLAEVGKQKLAAEKHHAEKEQAEKEKRARRNREKKLKRRQKEKLQKATGTLQDGEPPDQADPL